MLAVLLCIILYLFPCSSVYSPASPAQPSPPFSLSGSHSQLPACCWNNPPDAMTPRLFVTARLLSGLSPFLTLSSCFFPSLYVACPTLCHIFPLSSLTLSLSLPLPPPPLSLPLPPPSLSKSPLSLWSLCPLLLHTIYSHLCCGIDVMSLRQQVDRVTQPQP